ncbi:MAG TPA: putative metal-binding motif-containing protein [Myxococcales bacterium]|nr:putative metal-binding motif-containing protein [Myxococcales bacterium]
MRRGRLWCRPWLPLAAAAGLGCTGSSLVATVDVPSGLKATCIRVVALSGGAEITSALVPRPTPGPLTVAVFEPQGQTRQTSAVARGYVGNGCDEPLLLNEESAPVEAEFKIGGGSASLTLLPPPPALDTDGDGYRAASAGGPDCDDRRGSVHPAAAESCGDGADNDCDGLADCQQASCLGQPCGGGRSCTQAGTCEGRETQCTNGTDDDFDGLADCLDPDCDGVSCDDGDLCTTSDRCQAGQCAGNAVVCNSPPSNPCLATTGTCIAADGGCRYPPRPGLTCGGGVCDHDGGCGPLYSYSPANSFSPPAASAFVPLKFDCGQAFLDTTLGAATPFTGATCGQTNFPVLIDKSQSGAGPAAVIPVESLTIAAGSELVVTGPRPAIFAVFGDAVIDGRLTASYGQATSFSGAGTTTGQCGGGLGQNGASGTSGGGGGGGGYATAGGSGGSGNSGGGGGGAGGTYGNNTLAPLLGGCAGGRGANTNGPDPGRGGGAIQVSATDSLIVRGVVTAPGEGGNGGQAHLTGGGGGGAGGALLLEARSVRVGVTGRVAANGGGGGGGDSCCNSGIFDGNGGGDGTSDTGYAGGGGSTAGGGGGRGASATQTATTGGNGGTLALPGITYNSGGGGGGGGLGRIRLNGHQNCQVDGGTFSGALTSNQPGNNGCP